MDDDIFDYDWTQGGGDMTYFGGGDTSWIDNFDWGNALDNLDFSNLDLSNVIGPNFSTDFFNDVIPNINGYVTDYFNPIDTSWLSQGAFGGDAEAQPGGFYGDVGGTFGGDAEAQPGGFYGDVSTDAEAQQGGFYGNIPGQAEYDPRTNSTILYEPDGSIRDIVIHDDIIYDAEAQEGGFYGNTPNATYDPKTNTTTIRDNDGNVVRTIYHGPGTGGTTTPGTTKPGTTKAAQPSIDARKTSLMRMNVPELEKFTPGRGALFNPLSGAGEIPMARIDVGSIGNIFPSESVLDRLSGQMPIRVAEGGSIEGHNPEFYSEGGHRYVRGDGDGTSDSVPAMLARGEYVIPADVVSSLGNGDNEAGAEIMDEFLQVVREHKRDAEPGDLPEDSKGPLSYLAEAQENLRD